MGRGFAGGGAGGGGFAPDPSAQPDGKWLTTESGAYVFTDAPEGSLTSTGGAASGDVLTYTEGDPTATIDFSTVGNNGLMQYARDNAITITASQSSTYLGNNAVNAIDGSDSTESNATNTGNAWWKVVLTDAWIKPTYFAVRGRVATGSNNLSNFDIEGSNNGTDWTKIREVRNLAVPQATWVGIELINPQAVSYSQFRISMAGGLADSSGNTFLCMSEFEVYGSLYPTDVVGGVSWAAPSVSIPTFTATHAAGIGTLRWYNDTGSSITIAGARATISADAVDAATVVDVNVDDVSALDAPISIAVGTRTTKVTDEIVVPADSYLTVDVDSVGTPGAGETLAVQFYT